MREPLGAHQEPCQTRGVLAARRSPGLEPARLPDWPKAALPVSQGMHPLQAALQSVQPAAPYFDPTFLQGPKLLRPKQGLRSALSAQGSRRDLVSPQWRSSAFPQENPEGWDGLRHHGGCWDQSGSSYDVAPFRGLMTEVRQGNDYPASKFRVLISCSSVDQMFKRLTILEPCHLPLYMPEQGTHIGCGSCVGRDDDVLEAPERPVRGMRFSCKHIQ